MNYLKLRKCTIGMLIFSSLSLNFVSAARGEKGIKQENTQSVNLVERDEILTLNKYTNELEDFDSLPEEMQKFLQNSKKKKLSNSEFFLQLGELVERESTMSDEQLSQLFMISTLRFFTVDAPTDKSAKGVPMRHRSPFRFGGFFAAIEPALQQGPEDITQEEADYEVSSKEKLMTESVKVIQDSYKRCQDEIEYILYASSSHQDIKASNEQHHNNAMAARVCRYTYNMALAILYSDKEWIKSLGIEMTSCVKDMETAYATTNTGLLTHTRHMNRFFVKILKIAGDTAVALANIKKEICNKHDEKFGHKKYLRTTDCYEIPVDNSIVDALDAFAQKTQANFEAVGQNIAVKK